MGLRCCIPEQPQMAPLLSQGHVPSYFSDVPSVPTPWVCCRESRVQMTLGKAGWGCGCNSGHWWSCSSPSLFPPARSWVMLMLVGGSGSRAQPYSHSKNRVLSVLESLWERCPGSGSAGWHSRWMLCDTKEQSIPTGSPVSWRLTCSPRGETAEQPREALESLWSRERGWDADERNRFLL